MTPKMRVAIEEVFAELKAMNSEEFRALLDKHTNGDLARLLTYAGYPYIMNERLTAAGGHDEKEPGTTPI